MGRICQIPREMHYKDLDVAGWVVPTGQSAPTEVTFDDSPTPATATLAWRPKVKEVDIEKKRVGTSMVWRKTQE